VSRSSLRIQFTQTAARGRPAHRLAQGILSATTEFHPQGSSSSARKCTRPASSPATMMRQSEQAQHFTPASQTNMATAVPVSRSQTLRVLSRAAETAPRPSDVAATPKTRSVWPASVRKFRCPWYRVLLLYPVSNPERQSTGIEHRSGCCCQQGNPRCPGFAIGAGPL
jgi:hypothetical protein